VPWAAERSDATTRFAYRGNVVAANAASHGTPHPETRASDVASPRSLVYSTYVKGMRRHRKSWDVDWDVHCLTFSTFQRRPFFLGKRPPYWYLKVLARARQECPFHLFAYVIMPEHVHVVLQPLPGVAIRRVLWYLKRPMTTRVLRWVRRHRPDFLPRLAHMRPSGKIAHRFWLRGGGYDRNLRSPSDVHEKIRYIHANPVRRGLVEHPEDWPWSSAAEWISGRKGPVPIDWDALPEPELR